MKKLLAIILVFAAAICHSQQTNRTPLLRAYLQTQLDGNGKLATNFANPVSAQDLATKNYVDSHGGGATYTNNATDPPGVIVGSGIGTNASLLTITPPQIDGSELPDQAVLFNNNGTIDTYSLALLGTLVPGRVVTNAAELQLITPVTNQVVEMTGYFHTNGFGRGRFLWEPGTATVDNGIVFAAAGSGRYRRIYSPTNTIRAEWFGMFPANSHGPALDMRDQGTALQAALNATPKNNGTLILPPFPISVTNTITISNYFDLLVRGENENPSPKGKAWAYSASIVGYNGPTNLGSKLFYVADSGGVTFRGIGFDSRPSGNFSESSAWMSNFCDVLVDVDMTSGHITTTTANTFENCMFLERGTNFNRAVGVRIAYTAGSNCEGMKFKNCVFQGTGGGSAAYWVTTTNVGGYAGIQLGGGGGGANAFNVLVEDCDFAGYQYHIRGNAGTWDIQRGFGTAAGIAAFYLNSTGPSRIARYRSEGDRQFAVSPTTSPLLLEGNEIAQAYAWLSNPANIEAVDAINVTLRGNKWNDDASEPDRRSVTNSVNNTGWLTIGDGNKFANSRTDLIPWSRFLASHKAEGAFGTRSDNANIQKFPLSLWSETFQTNVHAFRFTDSSAPQLQTMPDVGQFHVGTAQQSDFGVFGKVATGVIVRFSDNIINPRWRFLANSAISELQANGHTSSSLEIASTNARVDLIAGNAKNTLNWRSGYGEITGTNDIQLMRFDVDGQIWFPYPTNLNIGSSRISMTSVAVTNQVGVGINTNNPGTNALFVVGSQTITSNLNVSGTISGNGSGFTNMMVSTITYGSTITPSLSIGGLVTYSTTPRRVAMRCTLTGNVTTVAAPTGTAVDGDTMIWEMIQDGTGGRTIAGWDSAYAFGDDITGITLSTAASKRDFVSWSYNSTAGKWYCVGFVRGY